MKTSNRLPLPSQEELQRLFDYDPETGVLVRKDLPARSYTTLPSSNAYRQVSINGKSFASHRIIWKLLYNSEPEQIDHINRKKYDNRQINLRAASCAINSQNRSKRSDNTSGICGVFYNTRRRKWTAHIAVNCKQIALGDFNEIGDAYLARIVAEELYGFSPTHGKDTIPGPPQWTPDPQAVLPDYF